jgi:mRNA interferase MazF
MYNDDFEGNAPGIQHYARPYVIVSSDVGNLSGNPVVIGLAMTSKFKPMSVNVSVKNVKGESNTVLCNQIKCLEKLKLVKYMGTLTPQKMKEIDKVMCVALGISINEEYKLPGVEDIIASAMTKADELRRGSADDFALQIAAKLDELVNMIDVRTHAGNTVSMGTGKEEPKKDIVITQEIFSNRSKRRSEKNDWSTQKKMQYVKDYESLSQIDVASKYNISVGSVYSYYSRFRKRLSNSPVARIARKGNK